MLPVDIERLALLGWHLYPKSRKGKAGCFKKASAAATCDLDQLTQWARQYPGCGWRVVCGPSGLFALDVDRPGTHHADGFAALRALTDKHGPLPPRPMTRSGGSGGAALFFCHQGEPLRGKSGHPAPGLDPHRAGQAIVVPPSRHHATGGVYTWRVAPWELAPPPIPEWLANLLRPAPEATLGAGKQPTEDRARAKVSAAVSAVANAPSGAANHTLYRWAHLLGGWSAAGVLSETDGLTALAHAASMRKIPDAEARATIKSGWVSGLRRPIQEAPRAGRH